MTIMPVEGKCSISGCPTTVIYAKDAPGSFYTGDVKNIDLRIFTGTEQKLTFTTLGSQAAILTFNFDIIYSEIDTRTPNDDTFKTESAKPASLFKIEKKP
jgi:hypothetical protein